MKTIMKKIGLIVIAALLFTVLGLTACGKGDGAETDSGLYEITLNAYDDQLYNNIGDGATSVTLTGNVTKKESVDAEGTPVEDAVITFSLKNAADLRAVSVIGNTVSVNHKAQFDGEKKEIVVVAKSSVGNATKEFTLTLNKHTEDIAALDTDIDDATQDYVLTLSGVSGNIQSVIVGENEIEFVESDGKININQDALRDYSGAIDVKLIAPSTVYNTSITVFDFVINNKVDFDTFVSWGKDEQLQELHANDYIVFAANIDYDYGLIDNLFDIYAFNGTIDGRGYSIYGVQTKLGLFRRTGPDCVIKNLGFLGIDVIEIARVEENTEYYNMKFASGIAGVSQGKFIDCYFDITVKNTVKHGIWLGGITSGTAQNGQPALKMENCIINTYFDEGFSSENVMYYGAVAGSADIPTNYKETVKNCYVVSNKNTRYGRVEGAVENKTYATKDALARSIGNFGLTGEYWSIVSGEVPVLEHMGELYSAFPTKVDSESLGDVYKESTDDSVTFDTSFVSGDIVKVKIDDKETAFTDNGGTVTVDRSVFDDLSGVVSVKIYTDSTMYLSSATAIDFVIDDADEFWYDFVAYAAGDEEGQALFANAYIVLATNIDCENQMIGDRGLFDKVEFNGTFDGRGYSIYNAVTDTGVFCLIGKGGIVKNLGLMNVQVTSYIESPILGGAYLASGIVCDGQGQFFDCYFDVHLTAPLADGGAVLYLGGITTERYRIINMSTGQHGYLRMENCIVKVAVDQEILDSYVAWKGAIMPQNLGGASCAGYATDCYFVSDINKFYSMYNGLPKHTYGGSKQDNSVYADFDALLADYPHIVFAGEYWVCAQGEVPKLVHAE